MTMCADCNFAFSSSISAGGAVTVGGGVNLARRRRSLISETFTCFLAVRLLAMVVANSAIAGLVSNLKLMREAYVKR